MRYKISYSLQAQLVDRDGTIVSSEPIIRKLDGLACVSDTVLNYGELSFAKECLLRGGHPRLVVGGNGHLTMVVEVDSQRRLSRKELSELQEDFAGQLTDGAERRSICNTGSRRSELPSRTRRVERDGLSGGAVGRAGSKKSAPSAASL